MSATSTPYVARWSNCAVSCTPSRPPSATGPQHQLLQVALQHQHQQQSVEVLWLRCGAALLVAVVQPAAAGWGCPSAVSAGRSAVRRCSGSAAPAAGRSKAHNWCGVTFRIEHSVGAASCSKRVSEPCQQGWWCCAGCCLGVFVQTGWPQCCAHLLAAGGEVGGLPAALAYTLCHVLQASKGGRVGTGHTSTSV